MLLPEKKEREYRFKLALRMGLPIFGLILVLVFTTLINNYENLSSAFYVESLLLLFVSVYFILYLIYKGFDTKITDPVSKVFTREYLYEYLKEQIEKEKNYTLVLIGIDNISDINSQYGIKNGDKVLREVALFIEEYFKSKEIVDFPVGRVKGGDFIIGLKGTVLENRPLLDLMCLKSSDLKVDMIEVAISGAIIDTSFSKDLDHLIDALFEQQELNRHKKELIQESIDPNELESLVIDAIENKNISFASQAVYDKDEKVAFVELFVRIKTKDGKYIHQKKYTKVLNKLGVTLDFEIMLIEKISQQIEQFHENKIAVTISTSSLRDNRFFQKVQECFKINSTLKERIIFIFNENEYYSKIERFNRIIHSFKNLGIAFALDRLGFFHSSFLYLRDLDIDIVRFDSSYTKADAIFKYDSVIQGLNLIIHEKKVQSWVKMIETKKQYEKAQSFGIDYIQGKYLSQQKEENVS